MNEMHSNTRAALWMGGWLALMMVTAIAGREAARTLSVFQVMELRSVIGFLMLMPLVVRSGGVGAMRTARPLAHLSRNAVHYVGQLAFLYAVTVISLAELVSIEFTTPFWTAILAVLFLGEKMTRATAAAIALGIVGVAVIVRPGAAAIEAGHLVMLGGAVAFGISLVMVKSLTRTESTVRIIFWMLVVQAAIGLAPALWLWRTPPAEAWPWIILISFSGTFSHFCMTRALVHADAMVVAPMDYLRVPLTALAGWLLYSEKIDAYIAIGAALILAGNLVNLTRRKAAS
ncbi:MAG TPA: DMT family transporter [Rhizobiales bacterium]|nr:DMT family transporter [Hyphomicrobiales bacterium]